MRPPVPRLPLEAQLRRQAAACAELGSPFYQRLLEYAAAGAQRGGPVADLLAAYDNRPVDDAIPLRLLASVNRLVLSGVADELVAHYPNVGGDGDADAAWPLVLKAMRTHRAAVVDGLTQAPQTNEVGRAAGLIGVLHLLTAQRDLPVRLLEIGASGGLNLRADRFRVTAHREPAGMGRSVQADDLADASNGAGPVDSPVVLVDGWEGRPPRGTARLRVVERLGCDVAPVDPATPDGALTLKSYVWPDQAARWDRLLRALEIARATPARVVRAGAADFLAGLTPATGRWTVVWHSVMWQYLAAEEQERVRDHIAAAGALATADAPVAHVAFEPYGSRFLVVARTWPDIGLGDGRQKVPDGEAVLASAPPHGMPVHWSGPSEQEPS